jgi:ATP-dependent Clp protease ATP-binding subunit ClpC
MHVTVPIYQRKEGAQLFWITLGLGPYNRIRRGQSKLKLQQGLSQDLRQQIERMEPAELEFLQMHLGIRLERHRLELTLHGERGRRKVTGLFPLILEPRWTTETKKVWVVYHPEKQEQWFLLDDEEKIVETATSFFQEAWAELDELSLSLLKSNEKDTMRVISFQASPKMLIDKLPEKKKNPWDDLEVKTDPNKNKRRGGYQVLPELGLNLSPRAAEGSLPRGIARSPYREQMQLLLCGKKKKSTLLVGPSGVGKSTIRNQWIWDLLCADGYEAHRNLDKVHDVWLISGKRMIAGMSYVGDWEERCIKVLEDAQKRHVVVIVEDLFLFGQLGRARDSDRNFADFFRGPVSRGEITMVGECTPEQLQRFEDDCPSFASLFTPLYVAPTTTAETLRMMLYEMRVLEPKHGVEFNPFTLRTLLELGGSLFPGMALPGKALDLLRQLASQFEGNIRRDENYIEPSKAIEVLSKRTGLPESILLQDKRLEAADLEKELSRWVVGQPAAIAAARDLILRIKSGLTDSKRPYGVYLFTGPTGTGKTELAKCIAEYLYGDTERLIRLDMSEFSSAYTASRLIGDRFSPEGNLTRQVQEQPFCVVLFDEIEKAHPSILNLLLQLFDEGRLTDAAGNTANFTHAVIIMTSNLGSSSRSTIGFGESAEALLLDVAKAVREFFPPELFNRIDRVVPFGPLSPAVGQKIVEKELLRLLSRRGLVERNVFVQVNEEVFSRVVREGFNSKDGARSLKRYLEENIASLMVAEVTKGKPGSINLFRLYEAGGEYRLYAESLQERESLSTPYSLEPLLELPLNELKKHLPPILEFLDQMEKGESLQHLASQIQHHLTLHNTGVRENDETLFNLDTMRMELKTFREHVETALRADDTKNYDNLEADLFTYDHITIPKAYSGGEGKEVRTLLFARSALEPAMPVFAREQILEMMASARFLERAAKKVHDPSQHAIFILLSRVASIEPKKKFEQEESEESFLAWMVKAYCSQRISFDGGDILSDSGIERISKQKPVINAKAKSVVLKFVGLGALDFFEHETGCHVWQSMSASPEVLRVEVFPAEPDTSSKDILENLIEREKRFQKGLAGGTQGEIENPRGLLPAVRKLRFDPPKQVNANAPIDIEDYAVGYTTQWRVKKIQDALERLWLLRMSRTQ